jgi:integrase/recombinase XerC
MNRAERGKKIPRNQLHEHHEQYVKDLRKRNVETRGTYERALREFFRWLLLDTGFRFRPADVERYKLYLTKRKKLAPVSVSTYLTALRQFCNYLVQKDILESNPGKSVKGNERPMHHTREILSPSDVQAVLMSIERMDERGFRDYAILKVMVGCGLSEIELIRADLKDIRSVSNAMVLFVQGKGKTTKDTGVILPPDVKESFLGYLAFRKDADENEPLFMSAGNRTRGKRMTTRGIRERVNMYLEKSGVKMGQKRKITPFSLRHTAIKMLAASGAGVEELQSRFRIGTAGTAQMYLETSTD